MYTWVTQMFQTQMFQKKGKIGTFAYKIRKCSNFFRKIFLEHLRLKNFFVVITFPFCQESEFKINFEVLTQLSKANQQVSWKTLGFLSIDFREIFLSQDAQVKSKTCSENFSPLHCTLPFVFVEFQPQELL